VEAVADVILRTRDKTDVDHVFVDFTYLADRGVDQALELAHTTLQLTR
jgi:hypothetical protein